MKNGVPRPHDGFDIIINGVDRSFRDRELGAYEATRYWKQRLPKDWVEVRVRATGKGS